MKLFSLIMAAVIVLSAGCATTPSTKVRDDTDEAISQGTYATNDSMKAGRFDLAYKYSNQTVRLVVPPKKRINVKPVYN